MNQILQDLHNAVESFKAQLEPLYAKRAEIIKAHNDVASTKLIDLMKVFNTGISATTFFRFDDIENYDKRMRWNVYLHSKESSWELATYRITSYRPDEFSCSNSSYYNDAEGTLLAGTRAALMMAFCEGSLQQVIHNLANERMALTAEVDQQISTLQKAMWAVENQIKKINDELAENAIELALQNRDKVECLPYMEREYDFDQELHTLKEARGYVHWQKNQNDEFLVSAYQIKAIKGAKTFIVEVWIGREGSYTDEFQVSRQKLVQLIKDVDQWNKEGAAYRTARNTEEVTKYNARKTAKS